jgi:hypothetical protein
VALAAFYCPHKQATKRTNRGKAEKRMTLEILLATWTKATPAQRREIGNAVENAFSGKTKTTINRIIRRKEAAMLLGVSVKRVDQLSQAGILKRIKATGTSRAIGISEASIRALTEQNEVSA